MRTPEEIAADVADRRTIKNYRNSQSIGGDGFRRAIATAAIESYRTELREEFAARIAEVEAEIEASTERDQMEFVFDARDAAGALLATIRTHLTEGASA